MIDWVRKDTVALPDAFVAIWSPVAAADDAEKPLREELRTWAAFLKAYRAQDWDACEGVQRGVRSRGYRPGPFSMREDAVQQFVQLVARSYLAGDLVP